MVVICYSDEVEDYEEEVIDEEEKDEDDCDD